MQRGTHDSSTQMAYIHYIDCSYQILILTIAMKMLVTTPLYDTYLRLMLEQQGSAS